MPNEHAPAELIMLSTPIGLDTLGSVFMVEAPFSACRLCGAIYQTDLDRQTYRYLQDGLLVERKITTPIGPAVDGSRIKSIFTGDPHACTVLDEATDRRIRWRKLHERRYHTEAEVTAFAKTGFAFTPEAAHRLAPYGITPMGNLHPEIVDALHKAPRAPVDDPEG